MYKDVTGIEGWGCLQERSGLESHFGLISTFSLPTKVLSQEILMKTKTPTTGRTDGVEKAEENAEKKAKQAGAAVALVRWETLRGEER